jgi:D-alanyl-D-alanine carboxypeptidase (penicillin-binding protein 5/6)
VQPDPLLNKPPRRRRRWGAVVGIVVLLLLLVGTVLFELFRPLPAVAATPTATSERRVAGDPPALPWPAKGQAAVAIQGVGTLGTFGGDTPGPVASITKVMTAYVVLSDHPLAAGEQGPAVTITAADVADFKKRQTAQESVVAVTAGEQLSEYQLLQGLLLPSGNNLADVVARFDAGSVDAFITKMNASATKLQMTHTKFVDTSGVSQQSQSTPGDLVFLSQQAMTLPVFAEIVKQPEVTLPVAGRVFNVDAVLGQDGIVGVKTGSLPDIGIAGFAFAATAQVGSQSIIVLGAVTGQDSLENAFNASKALIRAVKSGVKSERVVTAASEVGVYQAPWGAKASVLAPKDVQMFSWPGLTVKTTVEMPALAAPAQAETPAGTMTVSLGDQQVKLDLKTSGPIPEPGRRWRLTRIS